MKKIFIIILILMFIPIIKAESINKNIEISGKYQNFNGVNIDKENYNKIKNILTESEIENLTQEDYQEIEKSEKILDATIYVSEKKYVIVSGTRLLIEENDLSIAEYNEITDNNSNLVKTNSIDENVSYETTYKFIYMHASTSDNIETFYMRNRWKEMPANRSFDVFAMRWTNANNISIRTYNGTQDYKTTTNNTLQAIDYTQTSNNFQTFTNGISLSQNLVNNGTYYYQTIKVQVNCTGETTLYGTYQHAQGDVTLAQSKLFTIGSGGMGNVIYWGTNELNSIYDNTAGANLTFTC